MFQKNLEVLKSKNPALAAKLENITLESIKDIQVFEAESKDLIIAYKNTALHNMVDPVREANTTWNRMVRNEMKKTDIQVVFGLGLGYLFKRAYINAESKVLLLEPFVEVLRFVLEYVDFSKEFSDDRVYITDNLDDLIKKLQSDYLQGDKVEFLFLNAYIALAQDMLVSLTEKTLEICESKGADQNTILHQCKLWTKNFILNMPYYKESRPVGLFEGKFEDKPALILSAGPSLADNLELIKKNKNKFVTIAVASALRVLLDAGITPDFAIFADSQHLAQHVDGLEEQIKDVNLILGTRADTHVFEKQSKSKLLYFADTDSFSGWVRSIAEQSIGIYGSGGTVSILSYFFAKSLGCKTIAYSGLDMAFINNKMYADGAELTVHKQGHITGIAKKVIQVKSVNGDMIPSRDDYALFIRQFEEIFAKESKDIKIINTSLAGALINSMDYIGFNEFIKSLDNQAVDVNAVIKNIYSETSSSWSKDVDSLYSGMKKQLDVISGIDGRAQKLYSELDEISKLLETAGSQINSIQSRVEAANQPMIDLRREVIDNVFLSYYLQNEIWKFTRSYKTAVLPTLNDIKSNMQLEVEFFKMVCWACENVKEWLEESIKLNDSTSPALIDS